MFKFCLLFLFLKFAKSSNENLMKLFHQSNIVPDVIAKTPEALLKVHYPDHGPVHPGSTLTFDQVQQRPNLSWENVSKNGLYTLYMVNPDVPSREEPVEAEWQHWTVHNIPGNQLEKGTKNRRPKFLLIFKGAERVWTKLITSVEQV